MEAVAVINQKGGVSKSTTAHALAAGLTIRGYKVLMVDLDGQQSLTSITGATSGRYSILDVLTRKCRAEQATVHTGSGDILPAVDDLGDADAIIGTKATGRYYRLREGLKTVRSRYDYCVVDCPPSLGVLTINALTAADTCIVPAQADILSLQAIGKLQQTIEAVRATTNAELHVAGILITRFNGRAVLSRDAVELMQAKAQEMGTKVFDTKIRECISIKEAQAVRQSIYEYAGRSNGAKDYQEWIQELLQEV